MFVVLDDVFDYDTRMYIANFQYDRVSGKRLPLWCNKGFSQAHENIIDICSNYFDISSMVGYEMWCNKNFVASWHYDKDETELEKNSKLVFPLCSIVYYALIEDLREGDFMTEDIRIKPKNNRLVMFSQGTYHNVCSWEGTRIAVSINPWDNVPLEYRRDDGC